MTHPLRVAENCTTHPLHKAQNLMTHPLSAPAHPPYTFWPVPYLFLSLLSSSTVSKKVWSAGLRAYHFFLSCLSSASQLHFILLHWPKYPGRGGGGLHPRPKCPKKSLIREFFPSLFNLTVILFYFFFFCELKLGMKCSMKWLVGVAGNWA